MNHGSEQIRNNERLERYKRKACPAVIEKYTKACTDIKEIWNADGPVPWMVYELNMIRPTLPIAAMFEIDFLIAVLEC